MRLVIAAVVIVLLAAGLSRPYIRGAAFVVKAAGMQPPDTTFDPENGDFSGTRLWNAEGTGPGNFVMCLSCHSAHGGQPNTKIITGLNSPPEVDFFQALCTSCHARDRND